MRFEENKTVATTALFSVFVATCLGSQCDASNGYNSPVRLNSFVPAWESADEIRPFVDLVDGSSCKPAPNLMPRDLSAEGYRQKAHLLYGAGVENFFFWDRIERCRKATRLGHQEEVSAWIDDGEQAIVPNAVRVRKLGKWDLTLETPG